MAEQVSRHVSLSITKSRTQKQPKLTSVRHFEVDIPRNFQKWFSQFSQNFVLQKFSFYGTLGFLTCFCVDPRKPYLETPKTHFSTAFLSWHSGKFSKVKVFVFLHFREIFFLKKIHFMTQHFLDMFLCRSPNTVLKNSLNSPLYTILNLTFREIFKNDSFRFSQFSWNFVPETLIFMARWSYWLVSLSIPENRIQKQPKQTSLHHFEVDIPKNFQKWKYSIFPIFFKFYFFLITILCYTRLLDMFLCRSPKTALRNTKNSPVFSIFKFT